jgi:hypothetical protein
MSDTIEAEAALENCRALINQIDADLSAEEPFLVGREEPDFRLI